MFGGNAQSVHTRAVPIREIVQLYIRIYFVFNHTFFLFVNPVYVGMVQTHAQLREKGEKQNGSTFDTFSSYLAPTGKFPELRYLVHINFPPTKVVKDTSMSFLGPPMATDASMAKFGPWSSSGWILLLGQICYKISSPYS